MAAEQDPFELPGWQAISRESSLIRHLLGSGATALGKANYADQKGEYYTAFFALSVGLERLAKLVIVADHAIEHHGALPAQAVVRKFGHGVRDLIAKAHAIELKRKVAMRFPKPDDPVCDRIIECLESFADAQRGRYANFGALGDPNFGSEFEPIRKWWSEVAELILQRHYSGTAAQKRVEGNAEIIDAMISSFTFVRFVSETGEAMHDVKSASTRTGQTKIVQKYGRYYTLLVVRWLSEVFAELCRQACYEKGIDEFFGHHEHFFTFTVPDQFLLTRKIWPLT